MPTRTSSSTAPVTCGSFPTATRVRTPACRTVAVPRSCLGKPRSVQGAFGVVTFAGADVFADNPFDDGPTVNLPEHTPRIRRALTD
jgi:hypothetical protein